MDFGDLLDGIDRSVRDFMDDAAEVMPEELGLDRRAAYRLFVKDNVIAVSKGDDRTLQYYGGFEYVDKEYRHVFGDWVFYMADDDRVQGCLDRFESEVEDAE